MTTPTAHTNAVAGEIRALMGRKRLSAVDLAGTTGLSRTTISRTAAGARPLGLDELFEISLALGTTSAQILQDAEAVVAMTDEATASRPERSA